MDADSYQQIANPLVRDRVKVAIILHSQLEFGLSKACSSGVVDYDGSV